MRRLAFLLPVTVLIACERDVSHDPCQQACDITNPGLSGTVCMPCGTVPAPNDYGLCLCTVDAACPAGSEPFTRTPSALRPPTCP